LNNSKILAATTDEGKLSSLNSFIFLPGLIKMSPDLTKNLQNILTAGKTR